MNQWRSYALFLFSFHVRAFSCAFGFGKDEVRVEVRVEGDRRAERLALPALEAAEDFRLSFCQQIGHLPVGERLARYLAEHGQGQSGLSQRTTLP